MKLNELYPRLVADTNKTIANDNERLQIQFRWVLKILLLAIAIAGIISFFAKDYVLMAVIFLYALSFYGLYWLIFLYKDKGVRIVSIVLIVETCLIALYVLIFGGSDGFSPVWLLIVPCVVYLLLGRKHGTVAGFVILAEMIFFFWTPIGRSLTIYPYRPDVQLRLPIVYCVLFALSFFADTLRYITVNQLRESLEKMESIYQRQYSSITDKIAEAKKARHDTRHHFVTIRAYLDEGKTEEAKAYIDQYYQALPFEESLTYCEHYATNALLTYYLQRLQRNNITTDVKVNFPHELPWPTDMLTVIIGNLVENAVDASKEGMFEDETFEPQISIKGNFDGNNFMFVISNKAIRQAKKDSSGNYISSKHPGHGIGITSVKDIVEKHDGMFKIEQDDEMFTASVFLSK